MTCHATALEAIAIPDYVETYTRRQTVRLLSDNAKLKKAQADYVIRGLSLAPAKYSGIMNTCPFAGKCAKDCVLWFAGRTVTQTVRDAAIARTELYANDRPLFFERLHRELNLFKRYAKRIAHRPLCRLNVASDIDWRDVATAHSDMGMYDYTKDPDRMDTFCYGDWPRNYELTYSLNEKSRWEDCNGWLKSGCNVSVVFNVPRCGMHGKADPLPKTWRGFPVVDADTHDVRLREIDGSGVICGLRFKRAGCSCGKIAKPNGFIQDAFSG